MVAFIEGNKPDYLLILSWSNDRPDDGKAPPTIKRLNFALKSIDSAVII